MAAFRGMGCSVESLAAHGKGLADLLVGLQGINLLVEVKSGKGELTDDQRTFIASWRGGYDVVRTIDDVAALVTAARLQKRWLNYDVPRQTSGHPMSTPK